MGNDIKNLIKERPDLFDSPDSSVPFERADELERVGLSRERAERLLKGSEEQATKSKAGADQDENRSN